ncbi:MAG: Trm112 family protein [Pseudohongiellaceae bacterium]
MDKKLLSILACPICKGSLEYQREAGELICYPDSLAFPVRDDIPVMLEDEARKLSPEEKANRKKK